MLNLDTQTRMRGLTLFRDYSDERRWWYARDSPRIAREGGAPLFQLLLYRRDITDNPAFDPEGDRDGGGFLIMTVDLDVDADTIAAVSQNLAAATGGPVQLTPVPFESGTVAVKVLGVGPGIADAEGADKPANGFVERVVASANPSMTGANRAVFTVELDHESAQLLRASLEDDGASAITVQYDLEFVGLMPARKCSIHIENRRAYEHYRSRAQANSLWFKADIDNETERLLTTSAITIEDVTYLELDAAATAARATELQALAKELAQSTFFTPTLRPGDVLAKKRGTLSVYDPTADAEKDTTGFTTCVSTAPGGRGQIDDGPVVNAATTSRSGGVRGATTDDEPTNAGGGDTSDESTGPAGAETAGGSTLDSGEPLAVERWNRAGRPQTAYTLRSLHQVEQQSVDYDLRQVSARRRNHAPQGSIRLLAGDADLSGRIRMVDLDDAFWDRITGTVTTNTDLAAAGVASMVVQIRYGTNPNGTVPKDTAEFRLTGAGESHEFSFFVDEALTQQLEYRVSVNHLSDRAIGDASSQTTTEWITTTTRNLDLDPRDVGGAQPIRLVAGQIDWEAVRQIQMTLSYRDQANNIDDQTTVVLGAQSDDATVHIRPVPGGDIHPFTVVTTWFYAEANESTEQMVASGQEVVMNQPPTRSVPIELTVQDPLHRIAKVAIELAYQAEGGLEQSRMLSLTGGQSASWSFLRERASDAARYRYRATTFATTGTTRQDDWLETTSRQLVLGDVFPDLLEVDVEVIGDFAAAGIQLARLVLDYPAAPPGVDARDEHALRAGAPLELIHWSVASAISPPTAYRWEVTWVRGAGDVITEQGTSTQELLLLFVPQREAQPGPVSDPQPDQGG